jgi:zinc protease
MIYLHGGDARFGSSAAGIQANSEQAAKFMEPIMRQAPIQLVVVGDVEEAALVSAVSRTLGALPPRNRQQDTLNQDFVSFPLGNAVPLTYLEEGEFASEQTLISWPAFGLLESYEQVAAMQLLGQIVLSKLDIELLDTFGSHKRAAVNVVFDEGIKDWGRFSVGVSSEKTGLLVEIDELIFKVIERVQRGDLTQLEVEAVKHHLLQRIHLDRSKPDYWIYALRPTGAQIGRFEYIRNQDKIMASVALGDVVSVATKFLAREKSVRMHSIMIKD